MQVAVIGSGTMGNGIAHVFAQHGFAVSLIDINQPALDRGVATITKNLDRQVAKATLSEDEKTAKAGKPKTGGKFEIDPIRGPRDCLQQRLTLS